MRRGEPRLLVLDSISDVGGRVNEDRIGINGRAAWVIDGASSLSRRRLLPGASDAAWFARTIESELRARLVATQDHAIDWAELGEQLVDSVQAALLSKCRNPGDFPAAVMVCVHVTEETVQLYNIGDATLVVEYADGEVSRFGSSRIQEFDDAALQAMALGRRGESAADDHGPVVDEVLKQQRRVMNTPLGYWAIDPTDRWCGHVQHGKVSADEVRRFLLMSDGFGRLVEPFRSIPSHEALLHEALGGLTPLLELLRRIERSDSECIGFPRIKIHDDASAMLCEIVS